MRGIPTGFQGNNSLANVLFTFELDRRTRAAGLPITAVAVVSSKAYSWTRRNSVPSWQTLARWLDDNDRRAAEPARVPAPTRDESWQLFCEWTESDSLRKHALGVEAAMRARAPIVPITPGRTPRTPASAHDGASSG